VTAADKATTPRDMVLDARRDPNSWDRFKGRLDGTPVFAGGCTDLSHRLPAALQRLPGKIRAGDPRSEPTYGDLPTGIASGVWRRATRAIGWQLQGEAGPCLIEAAQRSTEERG